MREHVGFATIVGGVLALLSPAAATARTAPAPAPLPLVPMPQTVTRGSGSFTVADGARLAVPAGDAGAEAAARLLAAHVRVERGLTLAPIAGDAPIRFVRDATIAGDEAYRLDVDARGIRIAARRDRHALRIDAQHIRLVARHARVAHEPDRARARVASERKPPHDLHLLREQLGRGLRAGIARDDPRALADRQRAGLRLDRRGHRDQLRPLGHRRGRGHQQREHQRAETDHAGSFGNSAGSAGNAAEPALNGS